jgi:hypothetical protein
MPRSAEQTLGLSWQTADGASQDPVNAVEAVIIVFSRKVKDCHKARFVACDVSLSACPKSVERLLGFVPACLKLFATGAQQRQTLFHADFKAG